MKVGDWEIPELDPPEELVFAYESALEIRKLIHTGIVPYTQQGLQKWLQGGLNSRENASRQARYDAVRWLLGGRKLDEAETAFREAYLAHLHEPYPQGAAVVARYLHRQGDRVSGYPPAVAHLLAASI